MRAHTHMYTHPHPHARARTHTQTHTRMIHVQVVLAIQCSVSGMMITAQQLVLFGPIMLLFIGVPMSVCLHRYFSHKVLVYGALSY